MIASRVNTSESLKGPYAGSAVPVDDADSSDEGEKPFSGSTVNRGDGLGRVGPAASGIRYDALADSPDQPTPVDASEGRQTQDLRLALSYLLYGELDDYVALMDVLEASVIELSPGEVAQVLAGAGHPIPHDVVEDRLERLRHWG